MNIKQFVTNAIIESIGSERKVEKKSDFYHLFVHGKLDL